MAGRFSAWAAERRLPGARWTFSSSPHLTLQFLGETVSERRAAAEECLSAVGVPPFEAVLEGLGTFPDWRKPRVLWAGVSRGAEKLSSLAGSLNEELKIRHFSVEDRRYTPHVTLARFRNSPAGLDDLLAADLGTSWGTFTVDRICLFESHPSPHGPRYEILKESLLSSV
jgi:2'-5' RNA ligase